MLYSKNHTIMIGWLSLIYFYYVVFHAVLEPAGARDHYGHETFESPHLLLVNSNKTTITLAQPKYLRISVD